MSNGQGILAQLTSDRWLPWTLLSPVLIVLLAVTIYPFLYGAYISLTAYSVTGGAPFIGLQNYIDVLKDDRFHSAFITTLIFILSAVPLEFFIGLGVALLVNRDFQGKRVLLPLLYTPMIIAPIAVGLLWRMLFNVEYSPLNYFLLTARLVDEPVRWVSSAQYALFSLVIADVWQWMPFMFLVLFAGLQTVPPELVEAAQVDGASAWQVFRHISVPFLVPSMAVALLIRVMDAFKVFDKIFVLTHGGPGTATETISFYAYQAGFKYFNLGYAAAMAIILFYLVLIPSQIFISRLRRQT